MDFKELSIVKLLNNVAGQGAVQHEGSLVSLSEGSAEGRDEQGKPQARTGTVTGKKTLNLTAKYSHDLQIYFWHIKYRSNGK